MSVNVIVGIRINDEQQIIRCIIGYFDILSLAEKCVLENLDDLHRGKNRYIVIEEMTAGIFPTASAAHFYEWIDGQYTPIVKPKDLFKGIRNFSTGRGVLKDPIKEMQEELECVYYPQCKEPEWIFDTHCHGCKLYGESES